MRSDLLRRIRRLELKARTAQQYRWPVKLYYTYGTIDEEQQAALGPGERVVKDWCSCQSMFFVRARITMDPDDVGQRCGNPEDWPDEEGESPRSSESGAADDQQTCWHDRAEKEFRSSMRSPAATVTGPSPA